MMMRTNYLIGKCYWLGDGVEEDRTVAHEWLKRAVELRTME